jgi:hypothetical protein
MGVHIGVDAETLTPRRLDPRDRRRELRPIVLGRSFHVLDLGRRSRRAGDRDQLIEGLQKRVAFERMWLMYMPPHLFASATSAISSGVSA